MGNDALDKLIWVLIYGGLLTLCLSAFVIRSAPAFAATLAIGGAAAAVLGAVLIWVRSRRQP